MKGKVQAETCNERLPEVQPLDVEGRGLEGHLADDRIQAITLTAKCVLTVMAEPPYSSAYLCG